MNANQTRRFWNFKTLPQQAIADSEELTPPRETREQGRTHLSSSGARQMSASPSQRRMPRVRKAGWEAGIRAEGTGTTWVSAQGRPSFLRAVTHSHRSQSSKGMFGWQDLSTRSRLNAAPIKSTTLTRAETHSGPHAKQGTAARHSGPEQGDTEETSLQGQQTRQKQAAEMLEANLDSFKGLATRSS